MNIYFNEYKEACAFEIPNPIAEIDLETWKIYSEFKCGVDWDIIDGEFVKIKTEEQLKTMAKASLRISELKQYLSQTDYQAIKYSEGQLSEEEYAPMKAQRQAWRDEINRLEELE